jgi:glycosyltransferase involved in cell wall biosynthesis
LIINELRNRHPQGRFIIIPNSIDYEEYSDLLTEKGNQNNFLFGYAGKFDINNESYNPANLLAGFRNFILDNKQEKKIVLRVYSEINLTTKEYVSNLGISDNIELMGYCSKRDVIEGLSKCDAFIQFYYPKKLYNALSIKVFDYTYFKKPILSINTKSGILADYINKSRIGFVSENDSIDEITRNFQKIFTINLEKFKQNINAEYLARYSISKQISNLLEIFK